MVNNRNKSEVSDVYHIYYIENGQLMEKKYALFI